MHSDEVKTRLVVVDLDDCVFCPTIVTPPDYRKALTELADDLIPSLKTRGVDCAFCTGRDRNYAEACGFVSGIRHGIIESGIAHFDVVTKQLERNPALTPEVFRAFARVRSEFLPAILAEFPELFDYPGNLLNIALEVHPQTARMLLSDYWRIIKEKLRGLEEQMVLEVQLSKIAIDIIAAGPQGPINKASGLWFLAKKTGIPPSDMLYIGDSRGDHPAMSIAGVVGCPGNATDETKRFVVEREGYVAQGEYAAGVVEIIRHCLEKDGGRNRKNLLSRMGERFGITARRG